MFESHVELMTPDTASVHTAFGWIGLSCTSPAVNSQLRSKLPAHLCPRSLPLKKRNALAAHRPPLAPRGAPLAPPRGALDGGRRVHARVHHLNKQPAKTKFGHFYGSSYIAAPDASRCKGLSRTRDGVVIAEADLNLCRQVKDLWCLQMTARHADYAKFLSDYVAPDYKPQVVKDPSLS